MRSSKRVVKNVLVGVLVLAMGVATFANANSSYAAGEAKLNKTSRNILTRQSFDFDVTGAPADAVITWKSSDEKVATVDENGVVTGVKKGDATITCEVTSAGETQKLTAEVVIRKPAVKVEITNKVSELEYGKKADLNRTLTPKTSNDATMWKSSDTKIATVDSNGVVTALDDGTVTITAYTLSGRSDSVEITVFGAPEPEPEPGSDAKPTTKPAKPTTTPAKPTETTNKYSIADLEVGGGWYYMQTGTTIEFSQQYGEVQYKLPSAVAVSDCKSLTVALASASDAIAVKLYDAAGTMIGVWYDQVETKEYIPADTISGDKKIATIGIMANNKACAVNVSGITVVAKASASAAGSDTGNVVVDLEVVGGWHYSQTGDKIEYAQQYGEVQYKLPKTIAAGDYKTLTVALKDASDAVAVKLYDAAGNMLCVWYNQSATTEYTLADKLAGDAKIATIGIMANNTASTVTITGISFK